MPNVLFYPVKRVRLTQVFGVNAAFYRPMRGHNGLDFRVVFPGITPKGNVHVTPMAPGRVIEVGDQDIYRNGRVTRVGYGRFVRIQHDDGAQSVYAHLKEWYVKVGNRVGIETVIGLSNNTGRSTGSHLHVGYRPPNWHKIYNNGFLGYIDFRRMLKAKPGITQFL